HSFPTRRSSDLCAWNGSTLRAATDWTSCSSASWDASNNNYGRCPELALEDGGDAHAAGGADARAGRGERMAGRDARALGVQLFPVDGAQRGVAAQLVAAVALRLPALE